MRWLDQVLAVPSVGIQIVPNFSTASRYVSAAATLVDEVLEKDHEIIFDAKSPFDFAIRTKAGIGAKISATELVADFSYSVLPKPEAGNLPSFIQVTRRPYTSILDEVVGRLTHVFGTIAKFGAIKIRLFGIVATTRMESGSIPPGLEALTRHLGKPWQSPLVMAKSTLLANLDERDDATDRCHHTIAFDVTKEPKETHFVLDWQRVLREPAVLDADGVRVAFENCRAAALSYFDRVGEGALNFD